MDKPEDIPQAVWVQSVELWSEAHIRGMSTGEEYGPVVIARAILSAQSQAYIDAARIAEKDGETELSWANMELPISPGPVIAKDRARVASRISAAILQRKEEMGRETERIQSKVEG